MHPDLPKLSVIVSLLISTMSFGAHAETADDAWRIKVPVFLTAGTYVQDTPQSTDSHNALSAFIELRLWSPYRPWSLGLFVDRRFSPDDRSTDSIKTGTIFRHSSNPWDTTAAVFRSRPFGRPAVWNYAARIRYRFADGHKIGVESFGKHKQLDASYLMFGYYGTIWRNVSIQFVAGSNVSSSRDRAARAEFVWQIT